MTKLERRRTRSAELKVLSRATKIMEKVSGQLSGFEAMKTEVGRLTQVVGGDENSGMQKEVCDLKDTVNGNPVKEIKGLVPELDTAKTDVTFLKRSGAGMIAAIIAVIGTPLLWLLGNHPELLASLFKGKSGVQ